ncbi:MAG TPA: hypothetical protein VIL11_01310 [Limnochordales bacterium]
MAQDVRTATATQPIPLASRSVTPRVVAPPAQGPPGGPGDTLDPALSGAQAVASAVAQSLARAQVELAVQLQAHLDRLARLLEQAAGTVRQMQQTLVPQEQAVHPPAQGGASPSAVRE